MCGESWHAIKDSLTHCPSSQCWAPGVLPLNVQMCYLCRVCTWLEGGGPGGERLCDRSLYSVMHTSYVIFIIIHTFRVQ